MLDFFVAAPGLGLDGREPAELVPVDVRFSEDAVQRFNVGPASCGAYGTTLGLAETLERFGTARLADLTAAPARAAREGVEVVPLQAFLFEVLRPILTLDARVRRRSTRRRGGSSRRATPIRLPELGDLLDRLGAEGPSFLYSGDVAAAVSDWVLERGGMLSREDLSSYEVIEREPARVTYEGREVITNPPPSSGGILIADALGILERLGRPHDPYVIAEVIASTNRARDEEFLAGTRHRGLPGALPGQEGARHRGDGGALAPRQHDSYLGDGRRGCLRVGDLLERLVLWGGRARHRHAPEQHAGRAGPEPARVPPAPARRARAEHDGARRWCCARGGRRSRIGSAGSNRIRSAILQTVLGVVDHGLPAQEAVSAPRIHVEDRQVDAEPGVDEAALERLEEAGWTVRRWTEKNLFFGGAQAVARNPDTGRLTGGGDPRRGGVATVVD